MNLDPTVSPWIGIVTSTGVCFWMAAIGLPLSRAVFGDRPRPVWPFYAPALGIVVVLLVTNLSAYLIPGAPSAWFGLLAPSVLSVFIAGRSGQIRIPSRRGAVAFLALLLASIGLYVLAFANRTQTHHADESWPYALTLRLARGVFPPVTPYGVDAGIGYHYGHTLLAASIVNVAAVPAWTAMVVVLSFLVVALILAGVGFARDMGGSLPLSIGVGAVLGLSRGSIPVGLPPYIEGSGQSEGFARFIQGLFPSSASVAFNWLHVPQYALAVAIVILIAAGLHTHSATRMSVVVALAAGTSALADASVLIFSSAALGLIGVLRLVYLSGRERLALASALMSSGLLAALAGGPASDALFGRGGTAGMVRIAIEPNWAALAPFDVAGPALIRVGVLPLIAISAVVAYWRRSWALWYLTCASALGVVEFTLLQSPIPSNDGRILGLATLVAVVAALSGVARLATDVRGRWRSAATLAVMLLAVLPAVIPRMTAGLQLASQSFGIGQESTDDSGYPFVGQTPFRRELFRRDLEGNWDFYSWLSRYLTNDARLLTTYPATSASAAGVAAPTSGLGLQVVSPRVTPVYEDALRFLHRDDLADMQITHLHLTDAWRQALTPEARRLLEDPDHFTLLEDRRSVSGRRHQVFEVHPGAGTTQVQPSSFRALRPAIPPDQPFIILDGLTAFQRQMLLYALVDHPDLRAPPTFVDRATRMPRVKSESELPDRATIALSDKIDPLMLGLAADDAMWAGYGIRVYDLASAWSPVWPVGSDFPLPSGQLRQQCDRSSNGNLSLKLLGEPGDEVLSGLTSVALTGKAQVVDVTVGACQTLSLAAESSVSPFAQSRARGRDSNLKQTETDSALGFDGGFDQDKIIINVWYRNPNQSLIPAATELRLYEIGSTGVTPKHANPRLSIRWWMGPMSLSADTQTSRLEFDPNQIQLNGDYGGGVANEIIVGREYLLTLNVAVVGTRSRLAEIQQQIPILRFEAGAGSELSDVFSGIVRIRPPVELSGLAHEYSSKIGWEIDRTPGFETNEVFR